MADEAQDSDKTHDIESQIKSAILSRSSYIQDQADSLTFEKVRRLLEKDLGLETRALDAHKQFLNQLLQTCMESVTSDVSNREVDAGGNVVSSTEQQSVDEVQVKNDIEEPSSGGAETMEDSPVMGLMTGIKKAKTNKGAEDTESKVVPNEIIIKKAIWAKASYLRENSENITLAGLRRLLEEDLEVEKYTLDPFKKFISQQVDDVLDSSEVPQPPVSEKKNHDDSGKKVSPKASKVETSTSSGNESQEVEEEDVKVRKKNAPKKRQKPEAVNKRKRVDEDAKRAKTKQSKVSKSTLDRRDEEGTGDSEDDNSDLSAQEPVKKKEIPKPAYGKQVERLKSVIKSCGMSISPAVYKKVKQAPESKREACLIKELEEILAKEGLSTNPSEKEIKDVKKRKERAKELEGIDMSNIVSSSRRRSTASFIPPPRPKIPDLSESDSEDSENEDDEDEEGDEEVENDEEADEDQKNGGNDSQSEESDKGNSDSD